MDAADVCVDTPESQSGSTGTGSPACRNAADRHVIDMAPHNPGLLTFPSVKAFDRGGVSQGPAAPILGAEDSLGSGAALWADERLHTGGAPSVGEVTEAAVEAAAPWQGGVVTEARPAAADRPEGNGDADTHVEDAPFLDAKVDLFSAIQVRCRGQTVCASTHLAVASFAHSPTPPHVLPPPQPLPPQHWREGHSAIRSCSHARCAASFHLCRPTHE